MNPMDSGLAGPIVKDNAVISCEVTPGLLIYFSVFMDGRVKASHFIFFIHSLSLFIFIDSKWP